MLSKVTGVDRAGRWNERARNYPGRSVVKPTKLVNLHNTKKRRLGRQKSADGIVPKKKQGRPEGEREDTNDKYKGMQGTQKIRKKNGTI